MVKNRESQQFFQCDICDHFFQSESILEKHINGHQVEKLARFKVFPSPPSSPSKHKRKKKQRKKSEKGNKVHSNHNSINSKTNSKKELADVTNAIESDAMDIDTAPKTTDKKANHSEISNQHLPMDLDDNPESQAKCQASVVSNTELLNQQPNSPSLTSSNLITSIPPSPSELTIQGMDKLEDVSANPEIEQAVASISGPNLGEMDHPLQCSKSEGLDTDNNTMVPLTSGTLEIEKAVNSILGETCLSNDEPMVENNAIIFDIKQNAESTSHTSMITNNQEYDTAGNLVAEKDQNVVNGAVTDGLINGILDPHELSENIGIKHSEDSQMDNENQANVGHIDNTNTGQSFSMMPHQPQNIGIQEDSDTFSLDTAKPSSNSTHQAQNKLNGIDNIFPQTTNTTISSGAIQVGPVVKQYPESLETIDVPTYELSNSSSKVISNFDVPHSQFRTTNDALEKVSYATNLDSNMVMPTTHSNDLKASNTVKINNGDVSHHE